MVEDKLFSDIRFVLASQCHDPDDIKNILIEGGAKHINYLSEHVTHVIADSNCLEAEEALELYDKPVVSSLWVHLSLKANKLLPTEAFSPTKRYFNNVVAYFSKDLSQTDIENLAATITFYGGNLTKNYESATHFIALSSTPSDLPADKPHLKTVAPDWILDSVNLRAICDEVAYEPGLLLGPPPPTPPPPKEPEPCEQQQEKEAEVPRPDSSAEEKQSSNLNSPSKQTHVINNSNFTPSPLQPQSSQIQQQQQQLASSHHQQQQSQYQQQRPQIGQPMQTSQIPRPRIPSNTVRAASQPRFGPILPGQSANMPNQQRPTRQPIRVMAPEHQQPANPAAYNQNYRKVNPYQNNIDHHQQQPRLQPQQPPPQHLQQQHPQQQQQISQPAPQAYPNQHVPTHQPGNMMNQAPSRIPPPGSVYHHARGPYPNNHIPPRIGVPQPGMMTQSPQPMISQPQQMPSHMMNRFQDSNSQMPPRPYQVCAQPPQVNLNYQQGNMPRQPMYYAQNPNQNQMRLPQSGPMVRHQMHSDQLMHEGPVYNQQHPPHEPMQGVPHQPPQQQHQHYQVRQPHPGYSQHPSQQQQIPAQPVVHQYQPPQPQQHNLQLQHPPQQPPTVIMSPNRPPFHQPTLAPSGSGLRPPRNIHEPRGVTPRSAHPTTSGPHIRGPRTPIAQTQIQQQPHPSIFDHKLESSLTQMRAKVPSLTDNIEYFGFKPKENVPKNKPLTGCKFRLIEYADIDPKLVKSWCDIIKQAGGAMFDNLDDTTHLICQTRLTDTYSEALRKGIRCITIYWVNDVLHLSRMSYPWKPLHIPLPYDSDVKPLLHEMISITNFKGKERNSIKEMIKKTGARFTDHFSDMNTLLICAQAKGEKYDRALQWKTPVVNYTFLSDILLEKDKDVNVMLTQSKYTTINSDCRFRIDSYASIRDVMAPWTKPLLIEPPVEGPTPSITNGTPTNDANQILNASEDSGMATGGSNNSESDPTKGTANSEPALVEEPNSPKIISEREEAEPSNPNVNSNMIEPNSSDLNSTGNAMDTEEESAQTDKNVEANTSTEVMMETEDDKQAADETSSHKIDDATSTTTEPITTDKSMTGPIEEAKQPTKPLRDSSEPIRLLFTHMEPELTSQLQSYALKLGLSMASSPIDCTHLVVNRISRTPKFICAFSHASYILSHQWLLESFETGQVLDEKQFILQDSKGEEQYSFNLVYSLLKRKKRSSLLFNNIVFFVTPTVLAKVKCLKEMIESAGGVVATRKLPTRAQIDLMRSDGRRLVVVSNQQDLYLCSSLIPLDVAIVGYEFVISGILRQDIDFDAHRLAYNPQQTSQSETSLTRMRSPKRVRLD